MRESDRDYFARRAFEERQAAERASFGPARASHAKLAERYLEVATALEAAGESDGVNWAVVSRVSIEAERRSAASAPSPAAAEAVPDKS
jgi:hypothetical protein